jgi:chemotaxis protein CheY-P-specific phosphatase CheC/CheY-like chemotaxis protein
MARTLPKGWEVDITFAKNGAEGIEAIKAGKGEIVFLDLNMPVMDGYEVLEIIQREDLPALVIVVSGDIQIKAHERVKALGALDFIQKPVSADSISNILQEYGILTVALDEGVADSPMIKVDLRDACQEIANVAMGRAADLLAKLLDVFVLLPIPNVNVLEVSELTMTLKATEEHSKVSALCQGFIGAGIAGEALLLFHDSSFKDMAKLMGLANPEDINTEMEVMIDTGNVLIGAFLNGISEQLHMKFSQSHPVVLGRHCTVNDLIHDNSEKWSRTLAMEINYRIEDHDIQCDLLLLFTEDSLPTLNFKLGYLLD